MSFNHLGDKWKYESKFNLLWKNNNLNKKKYDTISYMHGWTLDTPWEAALWAQVEDPSAAGSTPAWGWGPAGAGSPQTVYPNRTAEKHTNQSKGKVKWFFCPQEFSLSKWLNVPSYKSTKFSIGKRMKTKFKKTCIFRLQFYLLLQLQVLSLMFSTV